VVSPLAVLYQSIVVPAAAVALKVTAVVVPQNVDTGAVTTGLAGNPLNTVVILAVDVHPFEPVTVTVYVPALIIVAFALLPNPPVHAYEAPPVAVTLIDVLVHVKVSLPVLFVIPAVGAVVFWVTVMLDVAIHPSALVTVTVYVPAAVMLALAALPNPPSHA
jgi:hypothetical protein